MLDPIDIARRARLLRLHQNLTQAELARRAGLGLATVQRFETSGQAGFDAVIAIAWALRAEAGFERLFELPPFKTIDQALAQEQLVTRKRARGRR
ncbi:MAG: helix-turn-helix domain-containing protein [Myxococcaceae bacterium]|nr:helix-turn-helix domain-containing protein [Myxococcaceae bacterium]